MIARQKIPASSLREGMYVAELDRPWLETPFLFQGFIVRSQRDIEELCRYCSWVFVDRELSEVDVPKKGRRQHSAAPARRGGLGSLLSRFLGRPEEESKSLDPIPSLAGLPRQSYPERKTSISDELPQAKASIAKAQDIVRQATETLRVSETIEASLVSEAVDPIVNSVLRNKDAMIWLQSMRGKDEYIFSRSVACSVWAVIFGRHLGLDRATLTHLAIGAMLLDLGKVDLPDELLTRNGPLDYDEMELVRKHVSNGVKMLEHSGGFDPAVIEMVRTHHERYNGTGYPHGLQGTEIPPLGKIAGILDTFVAMTSQRPYADAMASYDVMRHLHELADVEFQAELVEQFVQAVGMFPTGSLVELSTGEVAIVTGQNRVRRLRPQVMVLLDSSKQLLDSFRKIDLREQQTDDSGTVSLWITRGLPPGSFGIDPAEFFL